VARSVEVENASTDPTTITVTVPREFSPADEADVSGPLGLALLMAMRAGEDLQVDGLVDPGLHARLGEIRDIYRAFDPTLRSAAVTVRGLLKRNRPPSPLAGVYLSRGVDSMYAAAGGRTSVGALDGAIFIDGLVPGNGEAVRAQELRLVGEASKLLGLPLVVVEAPLRRWTDGIFDWSDAVGAGLAWVAHELSGGLGRVVIPSADSVNLLANACGTSPALDPLFSSRTMTIEHGFVSRTRLGKVQWLAEHRRDLLPLLKVCLTENRADNCGLCIKCLHTMVCLRAAGVMTQASQFPPELNLDAVAALRLPFLSLRYEFSVAQAAAAEAGDRPLAEALGVALEATARSGTVAQRRPIDSFRAANSNMYLTLIGSGRMNGNGRMTDLQDEPIKQVAAADAQREAEEALDSVADRARQQAFLVARANNAEQQLHAVEGRLLDLEQDHARLLAGHGPQKMRLERALREAEDLRHGLREVEDLRGRLERADGVINDLQDSVSWRVTSPLRRAKQAARRVRRLGT
jgi:hypothetical protein